MVEASWFFVLAGIFYVTLIVLLFWLFMVLSDAEIIRKAGEEDHVGLDV